VLSAAFVSLIVFQKSTEGENWGYMWTKNRQYSRYIGIADIFSSKISISYRFWKSGIDPSLFRTNMDEVYAQFTEQKCCVSLYGSSDSVSTS